MFLNCLKKHLKIPNFQDKNPKKVQNNGLWRHQHFNKLSIKWWSQRFALIDPEVQKKFYTVEKTGNFRKAKNFGTGYSPFLKRCVNYSDQTLNDDVVLQINQK